MARAQVHVVPIRVGGGTRLKILEAMAMKRPVVSTTVGAEGIGAQDGAHLLLAGDAEAFASAVGRLFDDWALCQRLGEGGHAFATQRFDWDRIGEHVEEAYGAAMDRARERAR
jgi:glycosyltransferase involved in cell wall biosynthesis